MRILISGSNGYVGPIVIEHLRRLFPEASLVGLDIRLFSFADPTFMLSLDQEMNLDIRDIEKADLPPIDAVVHLAAISNDPIGNKFRQVTEEINFRSTINLARKLKSQGCKRFVFASSCSVYGFCESEASENSSLNPLTDYAVSKANVERELRALANESFQVTCLRFATACGFSPGIRLDLVLNDFVARALLERKITILSDGTPWRPLIHVRDMAKAIEWALIRNGPDFLIVNAGSDQWNYRVIELAQAVAENIKGTSISINSDALPDKRSYRVNFSLFRELAPQHQPEVHINDAVKELIAGLTLIRSQFVSKELSFDGIAASLPQLIRLKSIELGIANNKLSSDLRVLANSA